MFEYRDFQSVRFVRVDPNEPIPIWLTDWNGVPHLIDTEILGEILRKSKRVQIKRVGDLALCYGRLRRGHPNEGVQVGEVLVAGFWSMGGVIVRCVVDGSAVRIVNHSFSPIRSVFLSEEVGSYVLPTSGRLTLRSDHLRTSFPGVSYREWVRDLCPNLRVTGNM